MNIVEKLKQFNVEVTPEMEKSFTGDFLSELEVEKKLSKLQNENKSLKERVETAEETLKKFDGKDIDSMQREIDEWKKKAEDAEKDYVAKEAEREKQELLKEAFADIEFTSNAAKNSIVKHISDNVSVKNGKLIGFNDLLEDAMKNDASAFAGKKENTPSITSGIVNNNNNGGKILTEKEIGSIKDTRERQKAWAEKIVRDNRIGKN